MPTEKEIAARLEKCMLPIQLDYDRLLSENERLRKARATLKTISDLCGSASNPSFADAIKAIAENGLNATKL